MKQKSKKEIKLFFIKNILFIAIPAVTVFIAMLFLVYHIQVEKNVERITFEANNSTVHRLVLANNLLVDMESRVDELQKSNTIRAFFQSEVPYADPRNFRIVVNEFRTIAQTTIASSSLLSFMAVQSAKSEYVLAQNLREAMEFITDKIPCPEGAETLHTSYRVEEGENSTYLMVFRPVYENEELLGTVIYGLQYEELQDFFDMKNPRLLGIRLFDNLGAVVLDTVPQDISEYRTIKTEASDVKDFRLECYNSVNESTKLYNTFTIDIMVIIFLVFIFLLLVTAFACLEIYMPFRELTEMMNDENALLHGTEYGMIIDNFKKSKWRYFFASRLQEQLEKLNKMQTIALQSQINPHFLSNTLQIIGLYSERQCGGDNKVSEMLVKLSEILRYIFSTKSHLVSTGAELEYLKLYVDIQKERFCNGFEMFIDIPPEMMKIQIPKVTFQPVVENAVRYCQQAGGNIYLSAKLEGNTAYFTIVNDGTPIDPELAQELNSRFLSNEIPEDMHIGLNNVNQRLRLIFGSEYGLKISYDAQGRTMITIAIPSA